ncbi:MAG TPA: carboxypeptidase regulatory-like domain-containing protein [Thermoanaerobaculia bacterium]|nr:carboxypeptidase regulatory-like domain-containing protein [Thermoanaerobaculia bacterium]
MLRRLARFLLGIALLAVPCVPARAAEIAVEGQVVGVDGMPLPGVRVELQPAFSRYEAEMRKLAGGDEPPPVAQDVTTVLGRFRVSAPRAGLWRIVTRADGYVPMELPVFPVLEERDLPAVTLRLDRGLRVQVVEPDGKPVPGVRVLGQTEKAVLWGTWWQPSGRVAVSGPGGGARLSRVAVAGRIVDASSRRPLAGALVWAADDPGSATWTDAAGAYRLSGRIPGSHGWLQAAAAGYASGSLRAGPPLGSSKSFQKVADLPLVPAPVPAITCVVVDEAGKALAGAEVLLVDPWPWGIPQQSRHLSTAPDGSFRIAPLQAGGLYALTASRSGFAPATLLVTAQLPSPAIPATRLTLRRGRTASGLVVDPRRQPIPGAAVRLISTRPKQPFNELQPELGPFGTVTGADGRFRLPHLPAGLFELRIEGPELAPLPKKEVAVPGGEGLVDLGTFTLEGRARIAGWVVDPGDRPVEGVEIWVVPKDCVDITQALHQASPAAVTGPDGHYELRDRAVGDAERLRACRKGYVPQEFPAQGPASTEPRIGLTPSVHLAGRVMSADGEPLPGTQVIAFPSGQVASDVITLDPPCPCPFGSSALAGAEGTFTLELASAGRYDVTANGAGHLRTTLPRLHVPREGLDGLEIRMDEGTMVSGHVADPEGHPVVGASISLSGPRSFASASSDGGGNFLLEGVETGERTAGARHDGFASEERKVQVRSEGTRIDFVLHPAPCLEIRGRVTGPDGAPVAGVLISDSRESTASLADGSFRLPVDPGAHSLLAEKDGFAPMKTEDVTVADRPVEGVEIRLGYGMTLTGQVLGIDPATVDKVSVFLASVMRFREAPLDSEGRFEVPSLPPGEWGLLAQAGDRTASERFTPPAGLTEVVHDLQFPPVSEIRGRVTGPGGEPIEGASLWLSESRPGVHFQTRTLADGSFAVGVTDGTYTLSVRAEGYSGRDAERPIVVAAAPVEDVEIQLGPNVVLSGRLLGMGPDETLQSLQAEGPPSYARGAWTTDQEGHYRQVGLWPGDWTITASASQGALPWLSPVRLTTGRIHIPPGATEVTLDLDFHVGDLTLAAHSAHPGEPFRATLLNADGSELIKYPSLEDGAFLFKRLQAGTYRLRIEGRPGQTVQEQPIELTADREVVIDLPAADLDKNPPP